MRITRIESWRERIPLSRPYTITRRTADEAELFFVRLIGDGPHVGLGSAAPSELVTGETAEACGAALDPARLNELIGQDLGRFGALCEQVERLLPETPAARAAVEMALYDLFARSLEVPVVDLLGARTEPLPTSVTIGIKSIDEALEDAREFIGKGFRCLKVKIGRAYEQDIERLRKIREAVGAGILIRVDANEGYGPAQLSRFQPLFYDLGIEFLEQPLPAADAETIREMPEGLRANVALDESLQTPRDAIRLGAPPAACGIFVIKMMKSGGIAPSMRIAGIAEAARVRVMWGCNDESRLSIAAALHAAYATPATRYLDLDGSFDLARDPAEGGFALENGELHLLDEPGLGVRLTE